jgi:hypothetical protein
MTPIRTLALVALIQLTCVSATIAAEAPGDAMIEAMYGTALMASKQGDAETAYSALEPALDPQIYDQLSPGRRYEVDLIMAHAASRLALWPEAHRAFVRATAGRQASETDWHLRLHAAIMSGDGEDSYATFRRLQQAGRPILASFGDGQIDRFDQLLRALPDPQAHLALGRQMEREAWRPLYANSNPSRLWLHYVEALLAAGDGKAAAVAAAHITDAAVMMAMQADRRFDLILAANPALRDPRAAAERSLAAAETYVRENPRSLGGRLAVVRALNTLGRKADALMILEGATRASALASRRDPPFDDMELGPTLEAERTSALLGVGRIDEGIGGRMAMVACHCLNDAPMRLARALLDVGRPQEAQRWLGEAPMEGLDARSMMELARINACVAADLNDRPGLERALTYLRANEARKPDALPAALVCAGRVDEAAATLTRQLADPRMRLAALNSLQSYAERAVPRPRDTELRARWAQVAQVPALKAEVDKVGRLNRFDLAQWDPVS